MANHLEFDGRTSDAREVREIMAEIRKLPGGVWGMEWVMGLTAWASKRVPTRAKEDKKGTE